MAASLSREKWTRSKYKLCRRDQEWCRRERPARARVARLHRFLAVRRGQPTQPGWQL